MTDEPGPDDWVPRATATDPASGSQPAAEEPQDEEPPLPQGELDEAQLPEDEVDQEEQEEEEALSRRPGSARRSAGFAAGRALVVLAAAGIGWYLVVPTHHAERSRLSMLVISQPGVTAYAKTKPQAGEQDDTQTGVAAVSAAAKKSPNQTGVYSIQWSPSQSSGAGVVALLFPNPSDAATAVSQLTDQQLSAGANSADSLTRTATFTVPGVPGSAGSVFSPSTKTDPTLATTLFRQGRVVSLAQAVSSAETAKADSTTLALNQYAKLRQVESGFTLSVKDYPVLTSGLWGAGAVVIAALAALGPILWRRRAEKRQLAYEAELASRVVVGRQVIVKHRR
jgi:hypothetical protein